MAHNSETAPTTASPFQALLADNAADLDASTNDLLRELEDLTLPYTVLAKEVRQIFYERMERYAEPGTASAGQERVVAAIDAQLQEMQRQAANLTRRRNAIIAKLPAEQRLHSAVDAAVAELEVGLLQIEEQTLLGFLGPVLKMINNVDDQIVRAQADLAGIQGAATRSGLGVSLETFRVALYSFKNSLRYYGGERSNSINQRLTQLDSLLSEHPGTPDSPEYTDSGSLISTPSTLDLGSPLMPVRELGELRLSTYYHARDEKYNSRSMFVFERSNPPALRDIAAWLGLDDDVAAAMVLNSSQIQNAYAAYRSKPKQSCLRNPEGLKLNMPLFTYSAETLDEWRDKLGSKQQDGLDFSAALFAHRAVRFLEGACEEVDWKLVSDHIRGLDDFEIARSHWAVALQIFWFLEKAFAS